MLIFDLTLNLHGFTITKTSGFNPLIYDLSCHAKPNCPHCSGEDLRKKDKILRQVWHESVGLRRVLLRFFISQISLPIVRALYFQLVSPIRAALCMANI